MAATVVVVAGGPPDSPDADRAVADRLPRADLVIAADSGAAHATRLGLHVDVLVGDLDSAAAADVDRAATVERHPRDKDKTDLELALDAAVARGAAHVVVVASLGGRADHALANVHVAAAAAYAAVDVDVLIGPATVHVVRPGRPRRLAADAGGLVTLLAVGGAARGVTTEGLAWPLTCEDLVPGSSRGVSNVAVADAATVAIGEGTLLAIVPGEPADPAGFPGMRTTGP